MFTTLNRPMTLEEIGLEREEEGGCITGWVGIDMEEVIDSNREQFLDLLSIKLVGCELLQDISYDIIGHDESMLVIEVYGDPDMVLELHCPIHDVEEVHDEGVRGGETKDAA